MKIIRLWLATVLLLLGVTAGSLALLAQTNDTAGASQTNFSPTRVRSPESQLAAYSKALNLSDDQKARIKVILDDSQKQRRALRKDAGFSIEERRTKAAALLKETNAKIRELLSDAQKLKWDAMQKNRRRRPPS